MAKHGKKYQAACQPDHVPDLYRKNPPPGDHGQGGHGRPSDPLRSSRGVIFLGYSSGLHYL